MDSVSGDIIHHNVDSELLEALWSNIRSPEATVISTFEEPEGVIPEDFIQFFDQIIAEQDSQDNTITLTKNGTNDVAVINHSNDTNIMEVPIIIDEMDIERHDIEVLREVSVPCAPTSNSTSEASSVCYSVPMYDLSPLAPSPPSYDHLSLLSLTSSQTSINNPPSTSQLYIPALENSSRISFDDPHTPIPQEPIPSTSSDTENYRHMRGINNRACKKYRQRRKNKLQELEKEKEALEIKNRDLKIAIKFHEKMLTTFSWNSMLFNKGKPKQQKQNTNLNELFIQAGIADLVTPNEFCPGCVTGDCSRIDCPNKT